MIRAVLIDNEKDNVGMWQNLLESCCLPMNIVGNATGLESGLAAIRTTRPDLVLLDIEMTGGNPFELINRSYPLFFQVIFVAAFDNYAIQAFKYGAVDYLLKPIKSEELQVAAQRVSERINVKRVVDQMPYFLQNMEAAQVSQRKMAVQTRAGLSFIKISEIVRFEARGNYTKIYLNSGEQLLGTRKIKEYEEMLPETLFFRIHNSHMVQLDKIRKFEKGDGGYVTMEDGSHIKVADRRRDEFMAKLLF